MPADMARCACNRRRRLGFGIAFEQEKSCAVRICRNGKAADSRDVFRRAADSAACSHHAPGVVIDIADGDIAVPAGPRAHGTCFFRDLHQAADHDGAGGQYGVRWTAHAGILYVPADYALIERLGGLGVAGHQVVPHKFCLVSISRRHCV